MRANCAFLTVVLFSTAAPLRAVVTLGASAQNFTLTGIGPNASGQGVSKMSWGACTYDGANTTCTLSGGYTGLGKGGTYSFVVSYPGNGAFPLNAVSAPGSNLFSAQATGPLTFVITLAETGGASIQFYSFANFNFQFSSATCTGVPANNCGVAAVGQTQGAAITGPIIGSFNPAPTILTSGVISASNYGGFSSIAPGTWIEIYGYNLATTRLRIWAGTDFNDNQAPSALAGTTVTIAGKPAYMYFVSPGQVNAQVPSGVASGQQPVIVTTAGGSSTAYLVNVNPVQPGLLAPASFVLQGTQHVVALFANSNTYVLPVAVAGLSTRRAKPGDILLLYGIGFGDVTPGLAAGQIAQQLTELNSAFQITIGGARATTSYSGLAPGYVGLYQFNVTVPDIAPNDNAPVEFSLAGSAGSQRLVIAIAN